MVQTEKKKEEEVVVVVVGNSEERAAATTLLDLWWAQDGTNGLVKDSLKTLLSQRRALEVLDRSYFVCQFLSLLSLNGRVPVVRQSLQSLLVFPQIYFGSCKYQLRLSAGCRHSVYLSIVWGRLGSDV